MIGLIVTALLQTFCALDQEDDSGYAFHCGEAGGMAAATAAFGVRALVSRVNYICRLASISFAGSPPRPGRVAGLRWCGSWGRQTPG